MQTPEEIKKFTINFCMWHTGESEKKIEKSYNKYLKGIESDSSNNLL